MKTDSIIPVLPEGHQAVFAALTCEKLLYSIAKFDALEPRKVTQLYEECISALYSFVLGMPIDLVEYTKLKQDLESYCPDLDESKNEFSSYALDSFVAMFEALDFVINRNSKHIINCATSATDTVDMYVQMASKTEPPANELDAFIQASPFMIREVTRQSLLLNELMKASIIDSVLITYLRTINEGENIIDLNNLWIGR
jgi:uncharacterized protein YjaG (DUF416 family)